MEYRCKGHIADLFWKKHNLIFEVQCSPMTLKECKRRTMDLQLQGMKVIWILHEKTFNKEHLSPMERYLRKKKLCFYTNIHQGGIGLIYDQEEAIYYGKRMRKSTPSPIQLSHPTFFFKKISFEGAITHYSLFSRLFANQHIWKAKIFFASRVLQRRWHYYILFLRWKIRL
ncbi:hypothetical protein K0U07_02765 [bacterium]|nr:hypothetical protein [bacterium]